MPRGWSGLSQRLVSGPGKYSTRETWKGLNKHFVQCSFFSFSLFSLLIYWCSLYSSLFMVLFLRLSSLGKASSHLNCLTVHFPNTELNPRKIGEWHLKSLQTRRSLHSSRQIGPISTLHTGRRICWLHRGGKRGFPMDSYYFFEYWVIVKPKSSCEIE